MHSAAAVVALLDHSLPLLRAKGVVSVLLLCRLAPRWLLELCRCRLMPALEKLARDKDDYVQVGGLTCSTPPQSARKFVSQFVDNLICLMKSDDHCFEARCWVCLVAHLGCLLPLKTSSLPLWI